MATLEQAEAAVGALREATTKVGERIDALIAEIRAGGLTSAQEDAKFAEVTEITGVLRAMGESVSNPVPIPVPEPSSGD